MKKLIIAFTTLFLATEIAAQPGKALDQSLTKKRVRLPNGWHLSPAGKSLPLGDLPLNLALSASKKYMAVTNNGQSVQSLQLIDTRTEKILEGTCKVRVHRGAGWLMLGGGHFHEPNRAWGICQGMTGPLKHHGLGTLDVYQD